MVSSQWLLSYLGSVFSARPRKLAQSEGIFISVTTVGKSGNSDSLSHSLSFPQTFYYCYVQKVCVAGACEFASNIIIKISPFFHFIGILRNIAISVLLIAPLIKFDHVPCGDGERPLTKCWYTKYHSRLDLGNPRLNPAFKFLQIIQLTCDSLII